MPRGLMVLLVAAAAGASCNPDSPDGPSSPAGDASAQADVRRMADVGAKGDGGPEGPGARPAPDASGTSDAGTKSDAPTGSDAKSISDVGATRDAPTTTDVSTRADAGVVVDGAAGLASGLRIRLEVTPQGWKAIEKPAEVAIDFTSRLQQAGRQGVFSPASLRVREVDARGAVLQGAVPFQFDRDADYDAQSRARGTLVFLVTGSTATGATRFFEVQFDDDAHAHAAAYVPPLVSVEDGVAYQGDTCFVVTTPSGSYTYQKSGAAFARLADKDGQDWIGYRPGGGSAGEYRGIPNLGSRYGHPGLKVATSTAVRQGPLKATLASRSLDGAWASSWDIYPSYARMTLEKAGAKYWILYEGTPGGRFEPETDYHVTSDGRRHRGSASWSGDLPAPEWVYFGDGTVPRALFYAKLEDDSASDQYWPMEGNMTVFGFGRQAPCCDQYLSQVPAHLVIGLVDASTHEEFVEAIASASNELVVRVGAVETF